MHQSRRSIAGSVIAAVVVVLIMIAVAAAYLALLAPAGGSSRASVKTSTPTAGTSPPAVGSSGTSSNSGAGGSNNGSDTSVTGITATTMVSSTTSCAVPVLSIVPSPTIVAAPSTDFAPLFGNFSKMSISYQVSLSASNSTSVTSSYSVISTSGSGSSKTYEVSVTESTQSAADQTAMAWIQTNGTVVAVELGGQNFTGSQGVASLAGFMGPFSVELSGTSQLSVYTSNPAFRLVNQTTTTIGGTSLGVTTYGADVLPVTVPTCAGTASLRAFSLQTGMVRGSSFLLVTYESLQGSLQTSSDVQTTNLTLRLLSVSPVQQIGV